MRIVGIDPGASGGISVIQALPTPTLFVDRLATGSLEALLAQIASYRDSESPVCVYVEQVGTGMPGNAAATVTKFARHNGHIDMALVAADYPDVTYVRPVRWMDDTVGGSRPKGQGNRTSRKKYIRDIAEYYWGCKIPIDLADAVMIGTYGLRHRLSNNPI
jgi:hypothetical protein